MIEMKKKTVHSSMKRWLMFRLAVGLIIISVGMIIVLAILGPVIQGNGLITKTHVDTKYQPTAEYLLTNPMPTPDGLYLRLELNPFSVDNNTTICIYPGPNLIAVNNSRVYGGWSYGSIGIICGVDSEDCSGVYSNLCIQGDLEAGLHLIEVDFRDFPQEGSTYYHQWAIEIESAK